MPDTATQLALLSARIDAAQAENRTKLDAIELLLTQRLDHLDDKVDALRADTDRRFVAVEVRVDDAGVRIRKLETDGARRGGGISVIWTIITGVLSGALTLVAAWVSGGHFKL